MDEKEKLEKIKNDLTLEQIESLLSFLGGEPIRQNNIITSKTICHCGQSHKLFYYDNTKLFRCYTECQDTFDIFQLVMKVQKTLNIDMTLPQALKYILRFFNIEDVSSLEDVNGYIEVFLDDLDEYSDTFKKEVKLNKLEKLRAKLSNYFDIFIGYEFPEYYDEDSKVVREEIKMVNLFINAVNSMKKTINEDNFNDFYILTRFIREKYYDYHNYLEKERSAVEMQFSGVFMNVPIPYELRKDGTRP